jgi:predicted metalloprotease with PDZ domain
MRSRLSVWVFTAALLAVTAVPALAAQGWLGVSTQQTDADLRRGLDLTRDGLLVNRVFADSPAERAGLKKGDVILRFDGQSVTEPEELRDAVREAGSGRTAKMEIWRLSAARTLEVKLAEVPDERAGLLRRCPGAPDAAHRSAPPRASGAGPVARARNCSATHRPRRPHLRPRPTATGACTARCT